MSQGMVIALATLLAAVLTGWMRSYALRVDLLDRPNERSSHAVPTPRGGGVAIVGSFLLALLCLGTAGAAAPRLCGALLGAGLVVATLGFVDDRGHVSVRWRLAGHATAATWGLAWVGPLAAPPMLGY